MKSHAWLSILAGIVATDHTLRDASKPDLYAQSRKVCGRLQHLHIVPHTHIRAVPQAPLCSLASTSTTTTTTPQPS
ncbi:hypothetical protein OH76DRAFT_137522 [Lentinus brumalis]|uniref:Secreted protein n=1 Tax=Lentinus brumalis TaxID=2498619 RepID=A0A371CPP3_9APHY|nr:hypothetical protein OH76DRAFT_137522 [Polyporus brumalis]